MIVSVAYVLCVVFIDISLFFVGAQKGKTMFRVAALVFLIGFSSVSFAESRVCAVANSTAAKATGGVAAASAAVGAAAQAAGMAAVAHSSGAVIATSAGGYLAGTLGTIGTAALAVVTAPAVLVGAATTAVAVGGTIAYCHYYDPPAKPRSSRPATARKPK